MKSFTDLEQSKKLAEILPIESADMYYFTIIRDYPYSQGKIKTIVKIMDGSFSSDCDTPCWSLAALLSVLPEIKGSKPIIALDDNYITYPHINGLYTKANNLIDACVDMIIKLNKQNLL